MIESRILTMPASAVANAEQASINTKLRLSPYDPQQIIRLPLSDSREDAPQILAYLNAAAEQFGRSPWIREFTQSILPPWTGNNDQSVIIGAIASFVRDRMRFLSDPEGGEYFIDPMALIGQIQSAGYAFGDCDDHVLLLNSMARSMGFDARAVGVHLNDPVLWDHVVSQVNVLGRWMDVDPCVKSNETPMYRQKLL